MKDQPILQIVIPATDHIHHYRLAELLGTSLSTSDRWVCSGKVSKPIRLGEKSTAFDVVKISHWLEERRNTST